MDYAADYLGKLTAQDLAGMSTKKLLDGFFLHLKPAITKLEREVVELRQVFLLAEELTSKDIPLGRFDGDTRKRRHAKLRDKVRGMKEAGYGKSSPVG